MSWMYKVQVVILLLELLLSPVSAFRRHGLRGSSSHLKRLTRRTETQNRYVFAHFMVGFVDEYTQDLWASDIALAHSKGIDGFALNCDGASGNTAQLGYAYAAAEAYNAALPATSTPFVLFVSPDYVHFSTSDPGSVATLLQPNIKSSAQFMYEGKAFVSSFEGDGNNWDEVETTLGVQLNVVPYYTATSGNAADSRVDGLFSWYVWPGQNTNAIVDANMTTDMDMTYVNLLEPLGKTYMMPVSPWFYTHLPASTGYPKNFYLYSDTLWPARWQQILDLSTAHSSTIKFVEIITWNDWTESSNIGPYMGGQFADGNYLWAQDFSHEAMMEIMVPFIAAFKAGQDSVTVEEDQLVYWYRPSLKAAECDSTDTCGTKPTGWDMAADSIFVAAMTTGEATITVTSGTTTSSQSVTSAGVHTLAFPMEVGAQKFTIDTAAGKSGTGTGSIQVSAGCYNGVYNFNILSGLVVANITSSNVVQSSQTLSTTTATSSTATSEPQSTPVEDVAALSPTEVVVTDTVYETTVVTV